MAIDLGDQRPWILLPGTLCTGVVFDPFLNALGVPVSARHVIELDSPRVEDFLARLERFTTEQAVICGFSLGAIVAGHLVDRITAAECLLFGLNPRADDPAKQQDRLALAASVDRMGGAAALAPLLGTFAGPDPVGVRARVLEMAEGTAQHIHAQTQLALNRPGALGALDRAKMPVTALTGTLDTHAPLPLAQQAAAAAPLGRVVALEGLGHYALLEDPAACARAVADALDAPLGYELRGQVR